MAKPNQPQPQAQPQKPATPKAERYLVRLKSPKGGEQLRFVAEKQKKTGKFVSYGFHSLVQEVDGKMRKAPGKGRGATQEHPTFEAAKAAADGMVKAAVSMGWIQNVPRGTAGRPDAFDIKSIPVPSN